MSFPRFEVLQPGTELDFFQIICLKYTQNNPLYWSEGKKYSLVGKSAIIEGGAVEVLIKSCLETNMWKWVWWDKTEHSETSVEVHNLKYTTKATVEFFVTKNLNVFEWFTLDQDLNLIGSLWQDLEMDYFDLHPIWQSLGNVSKKNGQNIRIQMWKSKWHILAAGTAAKGGSTNWWLLFLFNEPFCHSKKYFVASSIRYVRQIGKFLLNPFQLQVVKLQNVEYWFLPFVCLCHV